MSKISNTSFGKADKTQIYTMNVNLSDVSWATARPAWRTDSLPGDLGSALKCSYNWKEKASPREWQWKRRSCAISRAPKDILHLSLCYGLCPSSTQYKPVLGSVSSSLKGRKHNISPTESLESWSLGSTSFVHLEQKVPLTAAHLLQDPCSWVTSTQCWRLTYHSPLLVHLICQ